MATVTIIGIARQDATLFDNWQGDLSQIDIDASLRAYDAELIARLKRTYPDADIDTDSGLSYQSHPSIVIYVDGDDDRGTAEDLVRQVIETIGAAVIEDPDSWLVEEEA